jgi:YfiH family protein
LFEFQDTRDGVDVAFTNRDGGVSVGPYASLNLAESGGDDPDRVTENIDIVTRAFAGRPSTRDPDGGQPGEWKPLVVRMHQVHGVDVHVVDAQYAGSPTRRPLPGDGLVTTEPGVILMVRVADCVPVLLADADRQVVGAAHAGRNGMVAGVVPNTIARMRDMGAEDVTAWVGPHVCGRCYEVPKSMREEVAQRVPEAYSETSWGTPAVDVGAGVRSQLRSAGAEVVDASRCTVENDDLFSYRRQGTHSGRFAGLVWIRP